jgi:tripartite-type tricarboxylate transporter receptor subunit TctC
VAAKTPQPVVSRLSQEIARILHLPDVGQALAAQGLEAWTLAPEAFGAHIRSEAEKWTQVIKEAGINEG